MSSHHYRVSDVGGAVRVKGRCWEGC